MNIQIISRIENLEQELKELKNIVKYQAKKPSDKLSSMKSLWKKLKISDEDIKEAKKSLFGHDINKHIGKEA